MAQDRDDTGIHTPAEACAALAVLMVGADGVGTMEERRFLSERMGALSVFGSMEGAQLDALVADVTGRVWSARTTGEGRMTDEALAGLIGNIRAALPSDLRLDALSMCADLARSDGYAQVEHDLLERLRVELEVDRA